MTGSGSAKHRSIRTKVTVAMLAVALVPLAIVALVSYRSQRAAAERAALDRLAGIAAVQEARVNAYALSSVENLGLTTSRTQLRRSFAAELAEPAEENRELMHRILSDAVGSSMTATRIELVSTSGDVIASSDGEQIGQTRNDEPAFNAGLVRADVSHVVVTAESRFGLHAGPVVLDDELLGVALITASLDPLDALVKDYTGLGETGESVLASNANGETVQLLASVRFPDQLVDQTVFTGEVIPRGFAGNDGEVEGQSDYRQQEVFAVARGIDEVPSWALAVKVDRSEALTDVNRLRNLLLGVLVAVTIGVVTAALYLARALSRPVLELHRAAVAVASGHTEQRARVMSNDETADLALEFNRMTDELTAANARLQLSNEQLEDFVHISSHDLKSPLRSISSFGQLLQVQYGASLDDDGREYLGFIRDGAARMHAVIDDLLDYLRIEKQGHVMEEVDLDTLIDEIVELHRPELGEADADVKRRPLPTVKGSTALLRQLFDNIFQNAIRYRDPSRPLIIDVSSEVAKVMIGDEATADGPAVDGAGVDESLEGKPMNRIVVADSGVGVDPYRREDAFGAFQRLSATGDGTGMGLAICRRIARRHDGDIRLDDSEHGGTAVVVTLPLTVSAELRESVTAGATA